jgi:DNA polymerase alpha subunit A
MIANCLGLDPSKYRSVSSSDKHEDQVATLSSQITDRDRFRDVEKLKFACHSCQMEFELEEMVRKEVRLFIDDLTNDIGNATQQENEPCYGHSCPKCNAILSAGQLINRFVCEMRKCIEKYYAGWMVCEESSCQHRTRIVSVYATICPVEHCRGVMTMEVLLV